MKNLIKTIEYPRHDYIAEGSEIRDCERIKDLLKREYNVNMSLESIANLWKDYSDDSSAGWLCLPDDNDLIDILWRYVN